MDTEKPVYDLIICGGGLAGLSLARQLDLNGFKASILVLELLVRPLPEAGFKIGESTIETGAYYFYNTLQLRDYLEEQHLEKLGLRYFYSSKGDFSSRPEYGVAKFLPAKSYQLDRGKLEHHLRALVEQSGAELRENVQVKDIDINADGPHVVTYVENGETRTARARWIVDAMGRPRYLQRKFGLGLKSPGQFNSTWWRVRGKVSVADFVDKSNTRWHERVHDDRWQSTNHMMGKGYWVWLIPLAPENTSVGIVTDESIHPFDSYNTYEKSIEWLRQHEPVVADALEGHEVIDFLKLRGYSYTSKQVFSADRWACVGVSGVFADPYYSVGSNMIGFANGYLQRMLEMDRAGTLTTEYVDFANRYFLALNDFLTDTIHRGYPNHHIGPIMALKTIWDYFVGWTTTDPQFYHETYLDPTLSKVMSGLISRVTVAQARVLELFEVWGKRTDTTGYTFEFIDYIEDLPTLKHLHVRNLFPKTENFRRMFENVRGAVDRIEELAQVIFRLAVADVLPEKLHLFPQSGWINIEAISLTPDLWEADGLFSPKTEPRDLGPLTNEIGRLFVVKMRGEETTFSQSAANAA
ncbi:NAD(P)/FAD-dependent oxidoreductase [Dokdonella soli]|uniref:Tryptophan 7-halogenase n=1 Tax=Dokdonella soli TaxID=529810 RepID=A0ABN1IZZ3_9GAMM